MIGFEEVAAEGLVVPVKTAVAAAIAQAPD